MLRFLLFFAGAFFGGAVTFVSMNFYDTLDEGISYTYRCDQLAREDDARRSAEKIIQQFLHKKDFAELEVIADAAGLEMQRFDKLDHVTIIVGHAVETAALEFEMFAGDNITILPIPGSTACKTLEDDDRQ